VTRDFVTISGLSDEDLAAIYAGATAPTRGDELAGVSVSLVFEHPSLRTRASSVAAVQQLGGRLSMFTGDEVGLDHREIAEDVARTLQATSEVVGLRVRDHGVFDRMAAATAGRLRLVNLLSNHEHPTQAVADVLTLADRFGGGDVQEIAGLTVAYLGDSNNVARSLVAALVRLGVSVRLGAPREYQFDQEELDRLGARARRGGTVRPFSTAADAARGADAVYTDVWTSMGQEAESERRRLDLAGFQINAALLALAAPGAAVLHCLPAHRGEEITAEVLESPNSLVWNQVRHRTSAMVGVLRWMKESPA
jgi:ornithine carbamoyltransferase